MTLSRKSMSLLPGLLLACGLGWAQGTLRDPTTPPPGAPRLAPPGGGAASAGDAGIAPAAPQAIIRITPVGGARRQAVIAGQPLEPGEHIGPWRLVTITAHGVVFKDSRGSRTVAVPSSSVRKTPLSGPAYEQ